MAQTPWNETVFNNAIEKFTVAIHFPQGCRRINKKDGKSSASAVTFDIQIKYGTGSWQNLKQTGGLLDDPTITVGLDNPIKDGFTYPKTYVAKEGHFNNNVLPITVRIQRKTVTFNGTQQEDSDFTTYNTSILQSVTGYRNVKAATDPKNTALAKTALSVLATNQLSGQIEGINALVQTHCWDWDQASNTWIIRDTNNPASLFLYVLTHPANPQRIVGGTVTEPYLVNPTDIATKVNLDKIKYWHNFCNQTRTYTDRYNVVHTFKYTYNSVMSNQRSVLEVLRDICAAGRASPALVDGKWTVNIDEEKTVNGVLQVVQHFSPHNSWGFEGVKALPKTPDALKIRIYDEDADYRENELIVYNTGYDEYDGVGVKGAELFESITLPGVTNKWHATDLGKWHFAQIKLRPEVYTLNTDIEYLVCNRGDLVKVTHDVPMWGLASGRIKNRIDPTIFELDETVPIETTKNYTIRVRGSSGISTERQVKKTFNVTSYSYIGTTVTLVLDSSIHPLEVGNSLTVNVASAINTAGALLTFVSGATVRYTKAGLSGQATNTPVTGTITLNDGYYSKIQTVSSLTTTECSPLDLFLYGELGQESQDLVVLSIEPTNSKSARITLIDYGVTDTYNIFTDYHNLTGKEFETQISTESINIYNSIGDLVPLIDETKVKSDDSAMEKTSTGVYVFGIMVPYNNPLDLPGTVDGVEGEFNRLTSNSSIGSRFVTAPLTKNSILFKDVEKDEAYKFRLRYFTSDGRVGLWSDWYNHTVVGRSIAPENVVDFDYVVTETGIQLSWEKCLAEDYKTTIVKDITGATWATGVELFNGPTTNWVWPTAVTNNYTLAAKHENASGIQSTDATTLSINYQQLSLSAIVVDIDNDNHQVPADEDGSNPVLLLSGTKISVLQGGTLLKYDGVGTASGRWKIVSRVATGGIVPAASINAVQNPTTGDDYAEVGNITAFTGDVGTITYTISGFTYNNNAPFTVTAVQSFVKQKSGENPIIYKIFMSTPTVYKNSPNNTTAGPFNEITGGAKKYVGNTSTNFGYLGITPYIGTTAGTESRVNVSGGDGVVFSPSPSDQSTKFVIRLYETNVSTTVLDTETVHVVFKGDVGLGNALVYAYKRSATAVTDNPGAVDYSFTTKQITTTTLANSWSKTIPTGTDPLYVTVASASSNTATDSIAANEWSTPVIQTKNGINSATVYLYRRNSTPSTAPTLRTGGSSTYTFNPGDITGFDPNWSDAIPDSANGTTVWVIQATAASDGATDTILDSEWSTPQILSSLGQGQVKGLSFLRSVSQPSTPTGGSYASPTATGWSDGIPSGSDPLWMTTRIFTSDGLSPQQAVWTTPQKTSALGDGVTAYFSANQTGPWSTTATTTDQWMRIDTTVNGVVTTGVPIKIKGEGGQGQVKGLSFLRSVSQPSTPTGGSYASPTATGWSDGIPSGSNPVWMVTRIFTSDGLTPQQAAWTTPQKVSALGDGVTAYFSANQTGPWSTTATSTDEWMRIDTTVNGVVTTGVAVKIKGEQGPVSTTPGPAGTPGDLFQKVYIATANQATVPSSPSGAPPGGWSATPPTLTGVQAQWESDGKGSWNGSSYTWTWSTPYLSYFKVNTLEAITTNTGSLNVSGTITSGSGSPAISGNAMTGSGGVIYNDGRFAFGNSTDYILWNGTSVVITGKGHFSASTSVLGIDAAVSGTASGGVTAGVRGTGGSYGVFGSGSSTAGVAGFTGSSGNGVLGSSNSSGTGVRGESSTGIAIKAVSTSGTGVEASGTLAFSGSATGTGSAFYGICTSSGNTTSQASICTGGYALTGTGIISVSGNVIGGTSDIRLKTNIVPLTGALQKVSSLSGFTYNHNELGGSLGLDTVERFVGLSAQDVEKVVPEAVKLAAFDTNTADGTSKTGNNYKTLQYEKLVPLLIEAIKELKQELDRFKTNSGAK
jgi:hypothetical protein